MKHESITRRTFIKTGATVAGAFYLGTPARIFSGDTIKTPVVLVRREDALDNNQRVNAAVVSDMLDEALMALTKEKEAQKAWQKIIKKEDIVGIKSNVWRYLPTPPELESHIRQRVLEAGVAESNISVRDRGLLRDDIFMKSTALINARPMRTHAWSGVGSLIKNYIMFVDKPYEWHDDSCADLAGIWKLPLVKDKTRLNVLVMLTPLFHGTGPHHFNPKYTWAYKGLLVGFDPVAVDSVGLRVIQAKRRAYFAEARPVNPPAKHILLADTRHRLGTADPAKIDLIKIGWDKDILI